LTFLLIKSKELSVKFGITEKYTITGRYKQVPGVYNLNLDIFMGIVAASYAIPDSIIVTMFNNTSDIVTFYPRLDAYDVKLQPIRYDMQFQPITIKKQYSLTGLNTGVSPKTYIFDNLDFIGLERIIMEIGVILSNGMIHNILKVKI